MHETDLGQQRLLQELAGQTRECRSSPLHRPTTNSKYPRQFRAAAIVGASFRQKSFLLHRVLCELRALDHGRPQELCPSAAPCVVCMSILQLVNRLTAPFRINLSTLAYASTSYGFPNLINVTRVDASWNGYTPVTLVFEPHDDGKKIHTKHYIGLTLGCW